MGVCLCITCLFVVLFIAVAARVDEICLEIRKNGLENQMPAKMIQRIVITRMVYCLHIMYYRLHLSPSLSLSLTPSSLWSTVVIVKSWHFDNIVSIPPIWSDSIIMFRMEFHLLCALENSSHHNLQVRIMFLIA